MIPDIASYAPYIAAVFGDAPLTQRIPYAIADRGARDESTLVEGLFALFDVIGGRWSVSEVMGLLEVAAVQRRFGIGAQSLAQIRHWLDAVGVRWGRDREHWRAKDLPVVDDAQGEQPNTWAFGIERLLLGYALPTGAAPFAGVLPADNVIGPAVAELTALLAFVEALDNAAQVLRAPAPPGEWRTRLEQLLEALFAVDEDDAAEVRGLAVIRRALADLERETNNASLTSALALATVAEYLRDRLLSVDEAPGYLSGRVTFCTLVPMRAIPFRLVCLLGMNDGDFPRHAPPVAFDLLARTAAQSLDENARASDVAIDEATRAFSSAARPRKGDRSRGAEDRQMFLDALLSARDALYVSYVGASDRDNAARNPSVVVSELIDYVDAHFRPATDATDALLMTALATRHRLQPFSSRYFGGGAPRVMDARLFSYDKRWLPRAATASTARTAAMKRAAPQEVVALDPVISLTDLRAFIRAPSRWLVQNRLGARFPRDADADAEDEPFTLEALERYRVTSDALSAAQLDRLADWRMRAALSGELPQGRGGAAIADAVADKMLKLAAVVEALGFAATTTLEIHCALEGASIVGALDGMTAKGWRGLRVGQLSDKDRAELWLVQLLLIASEVRLPAAFIDEAKLWAVDTSELTPNHARRVMTRLVQLMQEFSDASPRLLAATAQTFAETGDVVASLRKWRGRDEDDDFGALGERRDQYVQVLCGAGDEPNGEWQNIAVAIYGGMRITGTALGKVSR